MRGQAQPSVLLLQPSVSSRCPTRVQAFAGEYEVVAIDMRGYGDSERPKVGGVGGVCTPRPRRRDAPVEGQLRAAGPDGASANPAGLLPLAPAGAAGVLDGPAGGGRRRGGGGRGAHALHARGARLGRHGRLAHSRHRAAGGGAAGGALLPPPLGLRRPRPLQRRADEKVRRRPAGAACSGPARSGAACSAYPQVQHAECCA